MMKSLNHLFVMVAVFGSSLAMAAEEGEAHHAAAGHEGIPNSVWWMCLNFAMFLALMVYLLRKPIKEGFAAKVSNYESAVRRSEQARKEAEAKRLEIEQRLAQLQTSANASIETARQDAKKLSAQLNSEAQDLAKRLHEEAAKSARLEVDRAKQELQEEMLTQAIALSKKLLEDKIVDVDQKRLQTESVDKMNVKTGEAHS